LNVVKGIGDRFWVFLYDFGPQDRGEHVDHEPHVELLDAAGHGLVAHFLAFLSGEVSSGGYNDFGFVHDRCDFVELLIDFGNEFEHVIVNVCFWLDALEDVNHGSVVIDVSEDGEHSFLDPSPSVDEVLIDRFLALGEHYRGGVSKEGGLGILVGGLFRPSEGRFHGVDLADPFSDVDAVLARFPVEDRYFLLVDLDDLSSLSRGQRCNDWCSAT
jgi:hypothetical protein